MPVLKTSILFSVLISEKLNQARLHKEWSSFNIHEPRGSSVPHAALLLKGTHRSSIHICWVCRMLKQRKGCYLQKGRTQIGRYRLQALIWCHGWEDGEVDELGPCCWMKVKILNGLGEHLPITPSWKRCNGNCGGSEHSQLQNGMLGRRMKTEESPELGHWVLHPTKSHPSHSKAGPQHL